MSAKWQRAKAWDEAFFPPWAWPLKWLLRTFSGIPLAVVLLSLVMVYATLASVPIGLLAQIPTWVLYGITLVGAAAAAGLAGAAPAWLASGRLGLGTRLAVAGLAGLAFAACGVAAWVRWAWPALRWDRGTGEGLMLFANFVQRYDNVTLRRLPGLEMTELEFYAWWPLKLILILFVVNMVTATVRRIEFRFVNIGVLTVHSGIVLIAVGSIYYSALKREGDVLLIAGQPTERGHMTPGVPEDVYYDAQRVALHARIAGDRWMQLPLRGVPRYNAYGLDAGVEGETYWDLIGLEVEAGASRSLGVEAPPPPPTSGIGDLRFRAVGYAPYVDEPLVDWRRVPIEQVAAVAGAELNPLRVASLRLPQQGPDGELRARETPMAFLPRVPAQRVADFGNLTVEYLLEPAAEELEVLSGETPAAEHVLVVEAEGFAGVLPLSSRLGQGGGPFDNEAPAIETFELGETGWRLEILGLDAQPALEVVTPGYEGTTSSVARVRVVKGERESERARKREREESGGGERESERARKREREESGGGERESERAREREREENGEEEKGGGGRVADRSEGSPALGTRFVRWVYSRYPELSQDFVAGAGEGGRPMRSDPDAAVRIRYLDLSRVRFYLVEDRAGRIDLIVRTPDGGVTRLEAIGAHEGHELPVRIIERWAHAEKIERPAPTPPHLREEDRVGTHEKAMLAVEVSSERHPQWRRVVWLPFVQYLDRTVHEPMAERRYERWVRTPDGRAVELSFGRLWRRFPGFALSLLDFEMIEYAHRGAPRDYRSTVEVTATNTPVPRWSFLPEPVWARLPESVRFGRSDFEPFVHTAKLNAPLRAPFNVYDESANPLMHFFGRLASGLNPNQFKLAQAGWDPQTWERTRAAVDRGELERAFVSHTILHVGNNPGIHVIALGGIMIGVGTPWAFYVKPWILRRRKRRIQKELAEGTYRRPQGRKAKVAEVVA